MDSNELKYWIAFNRIPRIGRVRFKLLEDRFSSLAKAWEASASELVAAGLDDSSAKQITSRRPRIDPNVELQRLVEAGIQAVTWHDSDYPPRLKEI